MGFLFNRPTITHINNPDDDNEDFNSLFEIKALDDLDQSEEEIREIFGESSKSSSESTPQVQEQGEGPMDENPVDPQSDSVETPDELVVASSVPVRESGIDPAMEDSMNSSMKPGLVEGLVETKTSEKIVKPHEKKVIVWNNKGVTLSRLGKYDEALEAYDQALRIDPDYPNAWNNKGVVLSRLGKYPEALEAFDRALQTRSGIRT